MRSVICYLTGCTREEVVRALDTHLEAQGAGAPWLIRAKGGDAAAYVELHDGFAAELEEGGLAAIERALGGEVSVCVGADVSGRHPGKEEAEYFARSLLWRFRGVATDDYSDHLWTLEEIEGRMGRGLVFFTPG